MRTIVRDVNWGRRARNYSLVAMVIGLIWIGLEGLFF